MDNPTQRSISVSTRCNTCSFTTEQIVIFRLRTAWPLPTEYTTTHLHSLVCRKLQALVYAILPSTTAVFSYVIGPRKLSANEQFFVGAQTLVSLLQTTQIISDVCFITDHVAYASSDKGIHPNRLNRDISLFLPGVVAPHVYVRAWALGCFYSHNYQYQTFLQSSFPYKEAGTQHCSQGATLDEKLCRFVCHIAHDANGGGRRKW